jgi:hypothetical protein
MTMNFVPHFDLVRENHETELFLSPWSEGPWVLSAISF